MEKEHYIKSMLLMLVLLLSATAAAHDFEMNGIYYNINGNEATITFQGASSSEYSDEYFGSISLPATVTFNGTTYSVTRIGNNAFEGCHGLTSVVIPNSVTSIGNRAFMQCVRLTSLTIPNSVISIGDYAFAQCTFTYLAIPNSVASIGNSAFDNCSRLTSVIISNSVTSIGDFAFFSCCALTSIEIPNSVTSIGKNVFSYCDALTSISVESGNAIYDSRGSCNAIIEKSNNTLIAGCKNTIIPNSVTSIGDNAFAYCSGLTNIEIPNSVTSIGDESFAYCQGLTNLVIPNSVSSTGYRTFACCDALTSISVESGNAIYDSRGSCNAIIEKSNNTLIAGCKNTIIPNSVTSIGDNAFEGCRGLTSIAFPNSVTSIGTSAFYNCGGLTSVAIPNSVTSIGWGAFAYCSGLANIEIGNSVTYINDNAFNHCSDIENIYCYTTNPSTCSANTFDNYSATLHVPAASLAVYFTSSYWSNFENIIGDAVEPLGITMSDDSASIQLGEQILLTASVAPTNASCQTVNWYSTNSNIATVDNGTITAIEMGECDIIASCFGMQAICHVSVGNQLRLDKQEAELLPNHMLILTPTATIIPNGFVVTSSNPTVAAARVVSDGKVQVVGIKEGTTTITVDSADGTAIPATCLVTVYTEPGDLNSDGFINISDVTSLIDYLLGGDETSVTMKNVDVNGDGRINISDVTSLIDTLLSKTE